MNKTQLIDALSARYAGNKKAASHALESVLDTITREVAKGEKVAITGFGSFEKRVREARWVRNPQTGQRIKARKTAVPKFTPGADLKAVISGAKKLPKLTVTTADGAVKKVAASATAATGGGKKSTAKKAPAKKSASSTSASAKKSSPAKKSASKKSASSTSTAAKKSSPAKKSASKKSSPAKKSASSR